MNEPMDEPRHARHRTRLVPLAAVAVAAVVLLALVLRPDGTPAADGAAPTTADPAAAPPDVLGEPTHGTTPPPEESDAAAPPPVQGGPARRAPSVLVPEAPRSVVLPSLREVVVRSVSTTPDGTLDVPDDIREAGWWRGGSRVADPFGSTLIAGHIDSTTQGLGPFAELLQVQPGDQVEVRTRRLVQTFVVESSELVRRSTVSTLPGLFGPSGGRRLVLVTCAPPYDKPNGGYQNLALVTAVPVSEPERRQR